MSSSEPRNVSALWKTLLAETGGEYLAGLSGLTGVECGLENMSISSGPWATVLAGIEGKVYTAHMALSGRKQGDCFCLVPEENARKVAAIMSGPDFDQADNDTVKSVVSRVFNSFTYRLQRTLGVSIKVTSIGLCEVEALGAGLAVPALLQDWEMVGAAYRFNLSGQAEAIFYSFFHSELMSDELFYLSGIRKQTRESIIKKFSLAGLEAGAASLLIAGKSMGDLLFSFYADELDETERLYIIQKGETPSEKESRKQLICSRLGLVLDSVIRQRISQIKASANRKSKKLIDHAERTWFPDEFEWIENSELSDLIEAKLTGNERLWLCKQWGIEQESSEGGREQAFVFELREKIRARIVSLHSTLKSFPLPLKIRFEEKTIDLASFEDAGLECPAVPVENFKAMEGDLLFGEQRGARVRLDAGDNGGTVAKILDPGLLSDNRLAAALLNAQVRVDVEIGRVEMAWDDFAKIGHGDVIELDRLAGEPVDVFMEGVPARISHGEVVVISHLASPAYFGVRMLDACSPVSPQSDDWARWRKDTAGRAPVVRGRVLLGSTLHRFIDVLRLGEGSIMGLDTIPSDPFELVFESGQTLECDIVVQNEHFGVQILADARESQVSEGLRARRARDEGREAARGRITVDTTSKSGDEKKAYAIPSALLDATPPAMPFAFLDGVEVGPLTRLLQQEHPQTIAFILSFIEPPKAARVLCSLRHEIQSDVAERIALMDQVPSDIVRLTERVLEEEIMPGTLEAVMTTGGVDKTVAILSLVDRSTEKLIVESLAEKDPLLAEQIKKRLLMFEHVVLLDDRAVQKLLRNVDTTDVAKALKAVDSEVQDKISRNMPQKEATALKEEMDSMGPVRLADVEEAQQRIVAIIRELEKKGEFVIVRGKGRKHGSMSS